MSPPPVDETEALILRLRKGYGYYRNAAIALGLTPEQCLSRADAGLRISPWLEAKEDEEQARYHPATAADEVTDVWDDNARFYRLLKECLPHLNKHYVLSNLRPEERDRLRLIIEGGKALIAEYEGAES